MLLIVCIQMHLFVVGFKALGTQRIYLNLYRMIQCIPAIALELVLFNIQSYASDLVLKSLCCAYTILLLFGNNARKKDLFYYFKNYKYFNYII